MEQCLVVIHHPEEIETDLETQFQIFAQQEKDDHLQFIVKKNFYHNPNQKSFNKTYCVNANGFCNLICSN